MKMWQEVLKRYAEYSVEQIERFKKISEDCPYLASTDIDIKQISSQEKDQLSEIDLSSRSEILTGVNQLFVRFRQIADRKVSEKQAEEKFGKVNKLIPKEATIDFKSFFNWCEMYTPGIKIEELEWLYKTGYIPHLYLIKGEPRFHSNMWFMVDFIIREVKEKTGLGIISDFKDLKNLPHPWSVRLRLDLVHYMYYSWEIVKNILKYSDGLARKEGLTNEDFHIFERNMREGFYQNEGKVLSDKLIGLQDRLKLDTIKHYRDTFALYSFEAFPLSYLIHYIDTTKWRTWFLTEGEQQGLLSTYYPIKINAYHPYSKQNAYGSLTTFAESALALHEKRESLSDEDIIELYHRKDDQAGKRPCRICGDYFKPKKKSEVTCGRPACINENKNRSKRKSLSDKMRHF